MDHPAREAARLAALHGYAILDTEPEGGFDDLTRLAANICDAPIALVSLVDHDRQWFKARVGLEALETSRDFSFCAHAIRGDGLFLVPDATEDDRFATNPLVTGDPKIRFYVGSPLIAPDGHALGTLCVIDRVPRELTPLQAEALEILGRQVVAQLELRKALADARHAEAELRRAHDELEDRVQARTSELVAQAEMLRRAEEDYRGIFENAVEGIYQSSPDGRCLRANPALARMYGYATPAELVAELSDIGHQLYVDPGRREEFRRLIDERGAVAGFESQVRRKDGRIIWISEEARAARDDDGAVAHYEGIVSDITERRRAEAEIRSLNDELAAAYDATIEGWAKALDLRDKETEGHTRRVTEMSLRLARALGLGESEMVHIRRGALLHDIGKLGVPDAILLKPGGLTEEEWAVMRRHPGNAHDWLASIPVLRPALAIPHAHHEKWDGTGYPLGLAGESIPLAARLFAAVDIWDALRSDRPYRAAWPEDRVRAHLRSLSGSHLDPAIAAAFLRVLGGDESSVGVIPRPTDEASPGPAPEPRARPREASGGHRRAGSPARSTA